MLPLHPSPHCRGVALPSPPRPTPGVFLLTPAVPLSSLLPWGGLHLVFQVLRLTEVRVSEERPALLQRCEFAEKRCAEMEGQRDALATERQKLIDQMGAVKDAHAETQRELAGAASERRALEELLQRTEARLGDERAALRASADGAEARCAEVSRQRDAAVEERIRAAEAQSAAEADRRSAEDAALRLTAELKRLGEERTSTLERLGATDERNRELSMQLESAQNALAEGQEQRSALQREKTALAQNLAVTQTELRGKEVVARHSETRLHEEKLALQARCEAAEERCHEINARRDALQSDRARLQGACARAPAENSTACSIHDPPCSSCARCQALLHPFLPPASSSCTTCASSPAAQNATLSRAPPIIRLHAPCVAPLPNIPTIRLLLHAPRPADSYNALLDERNRLEERYGAMQSEKRGLEELALYVNAITRSGGGQGKSSGTGGGGAPQGVLPPASDLGSAAHASVLGGGLGGGGGGFASMTASYGGGGGGMHGGMGAGPPSFNSGAPHGTAALHASSSALPSAGRSDPYTRSFGRESGGSPPTCRGSGMGRAASTPPGAPHGPASVSWAPEDVQVSSAIAAARELSAQRASSSSTLELLDPRDAR